MKYVWGTAFICALLSLVTGVGVILLLALSGESYTAYSFQCVIALAVMVFAWTMRRKYRKEI